MSDEHEHEHDTTADDIGGHLDADVAGSANELDAELQALLAERAAANPRKTLDRDPVGTETTRRLIGVTAGTIALSTLVLLVALLIG